MLRIVTDSCTCDPCDTVLVSCPTLICLVSTQSPVRFSYVETCLSLRSSGHCFYNSCLHYWSTNLLLDCIRSISIDCTWLCFISIDFIQYVCSYLCLVHMFSCSAVVTDARLGHTTELCKIHMKLADTFTITVRRSSCSLFNPVLSGSPLRRCFLHTFWDAWVNPPTCIIYTFFLPDSSFNISVICVQVSMFVRMLQNSLQTL